MDIPELFHLSASLTSFDLAYFVTSALKVLKFVLIYIFDNFHVKIMEHIVQSF